MSDDILEQLAGALEITLGSEADLSDLWAAIEAHAIRLGWVNPLHPLLEQALRNLARESAMARYANSRCTFHGLLYLLEWPQLLRLEERLRLKSLAVASVGARQEPEVA